MRHRLFIPAASTGYTLNALSGSYTLTGATANIKASRKLNAAQGSYSISGNTANLKASRKLNAGAGSYSTTGTNASLLASRRLNAAPGSYTLSGSNAQLLATRKLNAQAGAYTLAGANAQLIRGRILNALAGSYSLSGTTAKMLASRILNAGEGTYTITGKTAQLTYSGAQVAIFGYYALEVAIRNMLQTEAVGATKFFIEGQDNEINNVSNMPLINVRISESQTQLIGIPNKYYETVMLSIDIYSFDFTSYRDASRIRSSILGAVRDAIIANKQFYSFLDMVLIEPGTTFNSGVLDGGKGHVAMATMTVMCGAYIN